MIRLIASDLDATLLDGQRKASPDTFEVIRELTDMGMRFCVCTGRAPDLAKSFMAPVLDCIDFVCANGCHVTIQGQVVENHRFSHDAVLALSTFVREHYAPSWLCPVVGAKYHVLVDTQEELEEFRRMRPVYCSKVGMPSENEQINACLLFCLPGTDVRAIAGELTRNFGKWLQFLPLNGPLLDVVPAGVSKAGGLQHVMDYYDIAPDEVIAYGDSMNDYDMLKLVGHPTVVANGYDEVKALAERIIAANTEHGVARDLRRVRDDLRAGGDGMGEQA